MGLQRRRQKRIEMLNLHKDKSFMNLSRDSLLHTPCFFLRSRERFPEDSLLPSFLSKFILPKVGWGVVQLTGTFCLDLYLSLVNFCITITLHAMNILCGGPSSKFSLLFSPSSSLYQLPLCRCYYPVTTTCGN